MKLFTYVEKFGENDNILDSAIKNRRALTDNPLITDDLLSKNVTNVINSLVSTVVNSNDIFTVTKTKALNEINIDNINCEGDFNITEVNQENIVTVEIKNEIKNSVTTKVKTNITTKISQIINQKKPSIDFITPIMTKNADVYKNTMNMSVDDIKKINAILKSASGNIAAAGFEGSGTVKNTLPGDISKTLGISPNVVSASLSNVINTDSFSTKVTNFVSMINDVSADNIINISNMTCGGSFNLRNLEQFNDIQAAFANSFNSSITTSISRSISTAIKKTYSSFYDGIQTNSINQPKDKTLAQFDNAEAMQLLTYYHLCTTDKPESIQLKCLIEKRLIELGGPTAPQPSPECKSFITQPTVAVTLPIALPPPVEVEIEIEAPPPPPTTIPLPPPTIPPTRPPAPAPTKPPQIVPPPPPTVPPQTSTAVYEEEEDESLIYIDEEPLPVEGFNLFKPPYLYYFIGGLLLLIIFIIVVIFYIQSGGNNDSDD